MSLAFNDEAAALIVVCCSSAQVLLRMLAVTVLHLAVPAGSPLRALEIPDALCVRCGVCIEQYVGVSRMLYACNCGQG